MEDSQILLKGNFSAEDIIIHNVEQSNRKIDPEVEASLAQVWENNFKIAKEQGKLIFDGESFRLEEFKVINGKLELTVSKFKYSVRSSLVSLAPKLIGKGMEYTANGLAIAGFIRTSDGKYIFGGKSGKTTSTLKVDFIGGIVEPKELKNGKDLIECNKAELKEEINIDAQDIQDIEVTGIIFSPTSNIIILTNTELNLTSEEVLEKFRLENDGEISEIIFKSPEELPDYVKEIGSYKPQALELLNNLK